MKFRKGVKAPHRKNTAHLRAERLPLPSVIRMPMSMHIGSPATAIAAVGDTVKVGQLIGKAGGFVSSPIHAPVSGVITGIEVISPVTGVRGPYIVIKPDGLQTPCEDITPPKIDCLEDVLQAIRDSGVVGLGGAGFPTAVKLTVKHIGSIDHLLINGAECEPYITCDTRTMIDDADLVWDGLRMLKKYIGVENILVGIENNKPEAIRVMSEYAAREPIAKICSMPSMYPQGSEKTLIYRLTGRVVPEGKLTSDVGCIVINCTTLASIMRYIKTGMPLVSKCITVDGSAVKTPKNVIVPIGTPVSEVLNFCGGLHDGVRKILLGGPMMGNAIPDTSAPVRKSTNAILAFTDDEAHIPRPTACINCGRCTTSCPMGLPVNELRRFYEHDQFDLLEKHKVNLCMECGCCTFVCPARKLLTQSMKVAKASLRAHKSADGK